MHLEFLQEESHLSQISYRTGAMPIQGTECEVAKLKRKWKIHTSQNLAGCFRSDLGTKSNFFSFSSDLQLSDLMSHQETPAQWRRLGNFFILLHHLWISQQTTDKRSVWTTGHKLCPGTAPVSLMSSPPQSHQVQEPKCSKIRINKEQTDRMEELCQTKPAQCSGSVWPVCSLAKW